MCNVLSMVAWLNNLISWCCVSYQSVNKVWSTLCLMFLLLFLISIDSIFYYWIDCVKHLVYYLMNAKRLFRFYKNGFLANPFLPVLFVFLLLLPFNYIFSFYSCIYIFIYCYISQRAEYSGIMHSHTSALPHTSLNWACAAPSHRDGSHVIIQKSALCSSTTINLAYNLKAALSKSAVALQCMTSPVMLTISVYSIKECLNTYKHIITLLLYVFVFIYYYRNISIVSSSTTRSLLKECVKRDNRLTSAATPQGDKNYLIS